MCVDVFLSVGTLSSLCPLQVQWLNSYYVKIRNLMGAELDRQGLKEEKEWMVKNTEPFLAAGSSAAVSSLWLTIIALTTALFHNAG